MTNSPDVRSALAAAALELLPPLVRTTLLEKPDFCKEYGLTADAVICFGDSDVFFQRSSLLKAARKILSDTSEMILTDKNGQEWKLRNFNGKNKPPSLRLSREKQQLFLPDFAVLSSERNTRLHSLNEAASRVNLPISIQDSWHDILSERALEDDEINEFYSELRDTPIERAQTLRSEILRGGSKISSLVPWSRRYFERLVGAYEGANSIEEYATGIGRALFHQLLSWQPYDGFLFCLLLSSHSSMVDEINIDQLGGDDLVRALNFLAEHGDRISQLGAIEVGLRNLPSRPEIAPFLVRLIEQIRDDDVNGQRSGFKLLSALFVLVDGELSRTRLLSSTRPFYRRLAALSQSALIHRQLVNVDADTDHFSSWAFDNRGEQYYMQSLVDMRLEPRWNPDLATASQIKADFLGRIMIAGRKHEQNIKESGLYDLIFANNPSSLQSLSDFFHPYLPGPLEGGTESSGFLPKEMAQTIETQLARDELQPSSFIALVNSALIFHIDADHAELAARALKLGSYRLARVRDKSQLVAILNGLATVSAVTRSRVLADELRILVRRYRRDPQYQLSVEQAMRLAAIAAASRANLNEWREFFGDWLSELAFSELEGNDGAVLHSHLMCLVRAAPELWVSCGRADAALRAYVGSR